MGLVLMLTGGSEAQSVTSNALPPRQLLERYGLARMWANQATLDSNLDRLKYISADETGVYTQSRGGIVTAYASESGEKLWARLIGRPGASSYPVATNASEVLVASGMNMYSLDKESGRIRWQLDLPHHPSTSPEIDDVHAYIGTLDGSAYAFSLPVIRQLYEEQRLPEWSNVTVVWRYRAGEEISSPPLSTGRAVAFGSRDGSIYSVFLDDGTLQFQFETDAPIRAPITRNEDALFVASEDARLFCVDQQSGRLRWQFVTGTPVRNVPVVIGPRVFAETSGSGLACVAVASGRLLWRNAQATGVIAASEERVYASDSLGNVLVLSAEDGVTSASLPLRALPHRVHNDRTDRLFLATPRGLVVALRERDSDFPQYHKFPERRPILPLFGEDAPPGESEAAPVNP
jgi:outer membrane protein assembly factor BamB